MELFSLFYLVNHRSTIRATLNFLIGIYALAFYYGSILVNNGTISSGGDIINVIFAIIIGKCDVTKNRFDSIRCFFYHIHYAVDSGDE